jgi:endonuclease/exonuclease/phosphatase family metal-dependent hydrolase
MLFRSRRAQRRALLATAVCVAAVGLVPAAAQAKQGEQKVKVMSRNLYLGADLTPAIAAGSLPALAAAGTQIWNTVQATDFPARAKVLATEIAQEEPELIGLQEAAHWFTGPPDGIPGLFPGATPATTSAIDFLAILQSELAAVGSPYVVVASQNEANIEGVTASGFDIRLLQRDVILAKKSKVDEGVLSCGNVIKGNYAANLSFTLLGIPNAVTSTRGFVSADCTLKGVRTVRFVNTHLEAFSSTYRYLQAQQLVTSGPASSTATPVILVGDLNSDPSNTTTPPGDLVPNNAAYFTAIGAGYADAWTADNPPTTSTSVAEPGDTSGFNELVNNPDTSTIDSRIDHVMTRGSAVVTKTKVTGLDPNNRTPGGLWPSDHAGVWSKITLP